jgi:hypothetical protein
MVKNTNEISGKAMAVIVGVICLISPWLSHISFFSKLLISLIGIILIWLGAR